MIIINKIYNYEIINYNIIQIKTINNLKEINNLKYIYFKLNNYETFY